jgi:shikimate kinase
VNIVLIGYRGTGKTSVADVLAKKLKYDLVSMDQEIIKLAGKSIPEIVSEHGWEYFRDLESKVAKDVSNRDKCVIDTGGGVVLRAENMTALAENGKIFWLKADINAIRKRIKEDSQRPSLTGHKMFLDEVEEVLAERTPLYEKYADFIIDTSNNSARKVAKQILELCFERKISNHGESED